MNYDDEDNIRPPDEALFATLLGPETPPRKRQQGRGRVRIVGRREDRINNNTRNREELFYSRNTQTQPLDSDLAAAIEASMAAWNEDAEYKAMLDAAALSQAQEEFEFDRMLRESAEEYERNCMGMYDAESDASVINVDRKLPMLKIQCQKLGRFDKSGKYAELWSDIVKGNIRLSHMELIKQVRVPETEKNIIASLVSC